MALDPPGTGRDPDLAARLEAALADRGASHVPRTEHLGPDGQPLYVNRLILEDSPYLLQHAHNPVDWRPWGEEALAEAARRGVPVFLSTGYATCHWCHVMEAESFDDAEVAAVLNARFVPVKLDREERPDIDHVYILATQLQNGHAGWPNTVFLRPDGAPFHTATYLPREALLTLLGAVSEAWETQRSEIDGVAERLSGAIRRAQAAPEPGGTAPGPELHAQVVSTLEELHNPLEGGFSQSQQFPQEGILLYLLDHWRRTGEARALGMATATLDAIAAGGIHDHVGGGFHRYATDPNWRTPHFEKMLYNQAQLAQAFVEGWEATGAARFRRAAERTFAYVLRDLTDAEGAFHAAEDADSRDASGELAEGAFYVWTPDQARAALGEEAGWAIRTLGLAERPTVEAGAVPHLTPGEDVDVDRLDPVLQRMRAAREARPRPLMDTKVIAGWNGLMIRALAEAARAFDRPDLAEAAARAGETLWSRHWDGTRLARLSGGEGPARGAGQLDDHAWLGLGFLALFEATGAELWRDRAAALAEAALDRFATGEGRLRMAAADGPLGPVLDSSDGAVPSGESSALALLARLDREFGDTEAGTGARRLLAALSGQLAAAPVARTTALRAARGLEDGRSTLRRVLARGTLRLRLAPGGERLRIDIAPGWHLNAAEPGHSDLIGAAVTGADAGWPEGMPRDLGFAESPVRVYEGRIDIALAPTEETVTLHLQPCSDRLCLSPVSARFRVAQ